jgi:hypothetical protein
VRPHLIPPDAARTITALLTLRDQVVASILAGVRSPCRVRKSAHWTDVDRDYESLRIGIQTLFRDLAIQASPGRIDNVFPIGDPQAATLRPGLRPEAVAPPGAVWLMSEREVRVASTVGG